MLGRLLRTTRTDVGLALGFAGAAYLVWALVADLSRFVVQSMITYTFQHDIVVKGPTKLVKVFFVDTGFVIQIVGVVWLVGTLVLVVQSSRQKMSISWAWMCAILQVCIAALGAVFVAWAAYLPFVPDPGQVSPTASPGAIVSGISLRVIMPVALLLWTTFLVWLMVERARFNRRGPTLRDGMRSNVFR
jgi:hypothetical protein